MNKPLGTPQINPINRSRGGQHFRDLDGKDISEDEFKSLREKIKAEQKPTATAGKKADGKASTQSDKESK